MDSGKKVEEMLSKTSVKYNEEDFSLILEKFKAVHPLIDAISKRLSPSDEKNYEFKLLVKLLFEMQEAKYTPLNKYQLMYKVIKIDNLLQYLLPELDPESSADKLEKYKGDTPIAKMDLEEQMALFRLSKNIIGDFSHFLTEDEINYHLTKFTQLCNGNCQPALLAEEKRTFTRLTKTPRLKQILFKEDVDNANVKLLLSHMGLFLLKAEDLAKSGNYYGSYMALISAGNCARFFNICGVDSKRTVTITKLLTDIRSSVEHSSTSGLHNENEFFQKIISPHIVKINDYVKAIESQSMSLEIPVDIRSYTKNASDSFPAFDRRAFVNKDREKAEELEKSGLETSSEKPELLSSRGRGRGVSRGKSEKEPSSSAPFEHKESGIQRGRGSDSGIRGRGGRGTTRGISEKGPSSAAPEEPKESRTQRGRGSDSGIRGRGGRGTPRGISEKEPSLTNPEEPRESRTQRGRGSDSGIRGRGGRGTPRGISEKEPYSPTMLEPKDHKGEKESPQFLSKDKKKLSKETCKEDELRDKKDHRPDKDDPGPPKKEPSATTTFVGIGASSITKEKQSQSGGNTSKEPKDSIQQGTNPHIVSTQPIQSLSLQAFNSSRTEPKEKKDWSKVSDKSTEKLDKPTVEVTKTIRLNSSEQTKKNTETPIVGIKKDETPKVEDTSQNTRRRNF